MFSVGVILGAVLLYLVTGTLDDHCIGFLMGSILCDVVNYIFKEGK